MNRIVLPALLCAGLSMLATGCGEAPAQTHTGGSGGARLSPQTIAEGQRIFRYDTFGDEQQWTDACACTKSCRTSIRSRRSRSA
jgi:hypothetical protein